MKFLCVSCDAAMKLIESKPPERGSLTLVYRCPSCDHELAMLTNPYETQVVSSLGVKVGPGGAEDGPQCPIPGVMREMGVGVESADAGVIWTAEASSRLENIPEFARPMAKSGIEKFASDHGLAQIDVGVLDRARDFFGM